jgi:hypothetical protein
MTKNLRLNSALTVLIISLFFIGLSSFKKQEGDGCTPTSADVERLCTASPYNQCLLTWIGGPCDGQQFVYNQMEAK